jgi:hypothetical protein
MDKNILYEDLTRKIYECALQKDLSKEIILAQRESIFSKYSELIELGKVDVPVYSDNENFYLWQDRKIMLYGQKTVSINDLYRKTYFYHNKLYQWLLAVGFEAYEEYLRKVVKILISDNAPRDAGKILAKIRNKLSLYKTMENEESRFLISLIEKFRHKIVHCNGAVPNQSEFLKEVLEPIGLYNSGKFDQKYEKCLASYVNGSFDDQIVLLEIPVPLHLPGIQAETTVLNNLFSELLNSAYYIREAL